MIRSEEKQGISNRFVLTILIVAIVASFVSWRVTGNFEWFKATMYGGLVSALNFWFLILFVSRLLTESQGFDYKTLAIFVGKFLILFGGLAMGYYLLRLPIFPLMIGFFSFIGGLVVEVIYWVISATIKR